MKHLQTNLILIFIAEIILTADNWTITCLIACACDIARLISRGKLQDGKLTPRPGWLAGRPVAPSRSFHINLLTLSAKVRHRHKTANFMRHAQPTCQSRAKAFLWSKGEKKKKKIGGKVLFQTGDQTAQGRGGKRMGQKNKLQGSLSKTQLVDRMAMTVCAGFLKCTSFLSSVFNFFVFFYTNANNINNFTE